ncbi:MAG: hypothetical protein AAF899_16725 [Pseudomonadota bacterium]
MATDRRNRCVGKAMLALPLLALAACADVPEGPPFSVTINTNVGFGRDADERDGISRVGETCIVRDSGDRGGRRISHAC